MKRDPDLIRDLLREIETRCDHRHPLFSKEIHLGEHTQIEISYHLALLDDAGLIAASESRYLDGSSNWTIDRLTWEGHEFISAASDDAHWEKTKAALERLGGFVYDIAKPILIEMARQQVKTILGFP